MNVNEIQGFLTTLACLLVLVVINFYHRQTQFARTSRLSDRVPQRCSFQLCMQIMGACVYLGCQLKLHVAIICCHFFFIRTAGIQLIFAK